MNTTYRITSYDVTTGEHVGPARLLQVVTCLNRVDAFTLYRSLTTAGYSVIVQEVVVKPSVSTLENITDLAAALLETA